MPHFTTIIIGAGAAGLMCAAQAGARGQSTLLIDHAEKIGEKIRISGGGRCNFTNIHTSPSHFLSNNPHFCKSALSRYTPQDFVALVERYHIAYHEKARGQLFCDGKATQIVEMLIQETEKAGVTLWAGTSVQSVAKTNDIFTLITSRGIITADNLVVATGGLSIPKIGATGFGYKIAEQFGHTVIPTRPALVPLTFTDDMNDLCASLSGLSVENAVVKADKKTFDEDLLFTHRGLSGPSILQISSYWREGSPLHVNLTPSLNATEWLRTARKNHARKNIATVLSDIIPTRLAQSIVALVGYDGQMANMNDKTLTAFADILNNWTLKPNGTEGYRTAEVTLGGVDTADISSKTFESQKVKGLYFIGEVLDVTGHLGGFNFQWAWSSGWCCGTAIAG